MDVHDRFGIEVLPEGVAGFGMLVAADVRGMGIGDALLERAIAFARHVGTHKVMLQLWPHNESALGLYEKYGFVGEGYFRRHYRRRNGELWDAIQMGLVLDETSPGSSLDARP